MLDSCGTSGTGETPQAQCFCAPRRLKRPAPRKASILEQMRPRRRDVLARRGGSPPAPRKSEHPKAEIPLTLIATMFMKGSFFKDCCL
ncbi:hypothetical protein FBF83_09775 [Pseudalkalibacillus hwajinpoensis]|uniref:Uncharacterized protein n=1 Tax=Guptibacillus hwajinpoensis TaxID=208199 RepID=A0A4U1MHU7_9BACL|nr:hypothetical protein FBF83_09775 [Pseudalkalibacillus hwajinpoensis]